jgi:predicted RNA-binding Zn ribbon-like protein
MIGKNWTNNETEIEEMPSSSAFLEMIKALQGAVDRVRICPICGKLFVALNDRSKTCGAVCSNRQSARKFYMKNQAAERKRKRDEYRAVQQRKDRLRNFLQRDRRRD